MDEATKLQWLEQAREQGIDAGFSLNMVAFPKITLNQIVHWSTSFKFIDFMKEELPLEARTFYHSWNFDWRGRMYTNSTILDPQNDDLSRGLLLFANSQPLTESGWIWLKRYTASLMRNRHIDDKFTEDEIEQWEEVQNLLNLKSFEGQDEACSKPIFITVLMRIVEDANKYQDIWAEGDIFKAKSEGFQRLAAIFSYVEAANNGGIGAKVSLPINQDASSSVYQHASLLVRDLKMAKTVNVINDGELPIDVYEKVIQDLRMQWVEKNPLAELNLTKEEIESIEQCVFNICSEKASHDNKLWCK